MDNIMKLASRPVTAADALSQCFESHFVTSACPWGEGEKGSCPYPCAKKDFTGKLRDNTFISGAPPPPPEHRKSK